jgi:hypothetical protein
MSFSQLVTQSLLKGTKSPSWTGGVPHHFPVRAPLNPIPSLSLTLSSLTLSLSRARSPLLSPPPPPRRSMRPRSSAHRIRLGRPRVRVSGLFVASCSGGSHGHYSVLPSQRWRVQPILPGAIEWSWLLSSTRHGGAGSEHRRRWLPLHRHVPGAPPR